jgi:hypothetical protein
MATGVLDHVQHLAATARGHTPDVRPQEVDGGKPAHGHGSGQ